MSSVDNEDIMEMKWKFSVNGNSDRKHIKPSSTKLLSHSEVYSI